LCSLIPDLISIKEQHLDSLSNVAAARDADLDAQMVFENS
jgi:hypothetical protein